ncbi:MAG TPA: hypothetical protein VFF77_06440 [Holophagaceae bacterium]|jgi:hypothetical protein|nr:hypothetical protein [Holophagaceae bacterium]
MRKFASSLVLATALFGASVLSAGAKTYQVTGPVMDVQGDVVTVQKGKDLWQINMPAGMTAKKGDKVTITYTMTATNVEVKGAKAEKPAKAAKAAKPAKK